MRQAAQVRALVDNGCQTVRIEGEGAPDRAFKPVLDSICDFLGPGDRLLVPDVTHLGTSPSVAVTFMKRLRDRGAKLRLLDSEAVEKAMRLRAPIQVTTPRRLRGTTAGRRSVDANMVRALSADGFGPSQIARKLGVSRMTVWRKLGATGS